MRVLVPNYRPNFRPLQLAISPMTTISDDGDRTCPICTEEMDLTDQQLKPCNCGYDICVWCWHHIMEMAEKDGTEGRCPACRSPYNKEKIVATAATCERIVAEVNAERRSKPQKAKPKTSAEARQNFSSVRVVQRNLVYIVGLPSNLSDESLLERKQYFGQYGKVLKVSITRPTGAAAQQASNTNTFTVYITYAREEEAVRCIQAVHDFVLEGKLLRAFFGTTKYCHNWLRNMSCSTPDCVYLHEFGSQEDSFAKDELTSAYTRSRVPQIASSNLQRRSGDVLPPPLDDVGSCMMLSCSKTINKTPANNTSSQARIPNNSVGNSTSLPAAASWGTRTSNCRQLSTGVTCSQSFGKQNLEMPDGSSVLSSMSASTKQTSSWNANNFTTPEVHEGRNVMRMDGLSRHTGSSEPGVGRHCVAAAVDVSSEVLRVGGFHNVSAWDDDVATSSKIPKEKHMVHLNGKSRPLGPLSATVVQEFQTSESGASSSVMLVSSHSSQPSDSCTSNPPASATEGKEADLSVAGNNINLVTDISPETHGRKQADFNLDKFSRKYTDADGSIRNLRLGITSVTINEAQDVDHPNLNEHIGSASNVCSAGMPKNSDSRLQQNFTYNRAEGLESGAVTPLSELSSARASRKICDWSSESQKQVYPTTGNEFKPPVSVVNAQSYILSDVKNETPCSSYSNHLTNLTTDLSNCSLNDGMRCTDTLVNGDSWLSNVDKTLLPLRKEFTLLTKKDDLNNYHKPGKILELSETYFTDEKVQSVGRVDNEDNIDEVSSVDIGENSIISDILDFDPWDDSLSSANLLARLLGKTSKDESSLLLSNTVKSPNRDQSSFSFARQENQLNYFDSSSQRAFSSAQNSCGNGFQSGPQVNNFLGLSAVINNAGVSYDKNAGVTWQQLSPPPGFSLANKTPPPGFSFKDRYDQTYETAFPENSSNGISSSSSQYQIQQSDNIADVEFIDPAIMAVGRGQILPALNNSGLALGPSFPPQFSGLENGPRIQLMLQQSASSHQNHSMSDHVGINFLPLKNANIASHQNQRISDQTRERFLTLNDAYTTSQHLPQSFNNEYPYAHLSLQQPRNSQILSNQWDIWNDRQTVNGTFSDVGMAEILRSKGLEFNNYYPRIEEHRTHIPNTDFYNRAFGI